MFVSGVAVIVGVVAIIINTCCALGLTILACVYRVDVCALLRYDLSLMPRRAFLLSCQKKQKALKVKGQWALALGAGHQSAAPILGYTSVGVRCGL